MRKHRRKNVAYVGFMDLEKAYDRVNREALWQGLRMNGVGGKLLNGIKSAYVGSLACVTVKVCESDCFRVDSGVRHVCIMFPWLFNVYMDELMELKMGMGRRGVKFQDEGRERRLAGLLYADDLVLCDESKEYLKPIVGRFTECVGEEV